MEDIIILEHDGMVQDSDHFTEIRKLLGQAYGKPDELVISSSSVTDGD
jgi:hypothetical protein